MMKQFRLIQWLDKSAEKIMLLLPDWVTGNSSVMYQKYKKRYGLKDCKSLIKQEKIKTMTVYLVISAFFIVMICSSEIIQCVKSKEITSVRRPEYGNQNLSVPVEIRVKYREYEINRAVNLKVQQKLLTEKEKRQILQVFGNQLNRIILGENTDLEHINKPLNLIERDQNTGILIQWVSDHPGIVNEEGEVDLLKAKDGQKVGLQAKLAMDEITVSKKVDLQIDRDASKDDYVRNLDHRIDDIIEELSESSSLEYVRLPEELEDGLEVRWVIGRSDNPILFLFFILALLIVYYKRYDRINQEIKESEESIIQDLPEFMNKIVLLLNAGLVVSSAISKIVKDYEAFNYGSNLKQSRLKKRYLYEELSEIQKRVNQSNSWLIKELKEFSQRSGVRELVRIIAVISDNWDKGSTMVEKLEGESELLWISRKKRAEERGRLAETKLTFPLMILLIVLITVTIAPALIGM
ncbi:MAG: hypothetical protein AAGU75_01680 [Bacillota bacterium]